MAGFDSYEAIQGLSASNVGIYANEPSVAESVCRFDPDPPEAISIDVSPPGTTLSYSFLSIRGTLQCVRTLRQTGWGIARITQFVLTEAQLDALLQADEYYEGRVRYFDKVKHSAMHYLDD